MSLEKIRMAIQEAGITGLIAFPVVFCRVVKAKDVRDTACAYGTKNQILLPDFPRAASHEQVPLRCIRPPKRLPPQSG